MVEALKKHKRCVICFMCSNSISHFAFPLAGLLGRVCREARVPLSLCALSSQCIEQEKFSFFELESILTCRLLLL